MAGKQRSPRYPSLSLAEAVDKARRIYSVEHTHAAPREVVVKHVGYSSLNGASLTLLATLIRYGLLEQEGDGVRISEDAMAIFELPASDPAHAEALRACALRPELLAELHAQFGNQLPSEGNLRHSLIKRGFLPKAADEVIRVYRENLEFVGVSANGYYETVDTAQTEQRDVISQPHATPKAASLPLPGFRQDVFSLEEGPVSIQWPAAISASSFEDLADWLEILKRKIGRSVKVEADES